MNLRLRWKYCVSAAAVGAVVVAGWACKPQPGSKRATGNRAGDTRMPARVADATVMVAWGAIELDDAGRLKARIVAPLDVIPSTVPGSAVLPTCRAPLSATTELGELKCIAGSTSKVSLLVSHVDQECYTNPQVKVVPATNSVILAGCRRAEISGFRFDPEVRIDIEPR